MKLLDMGADANAWGRHGSPLKAACFGGHDDVVRLLIRRGAVMDATNGKWNALEAATSRGYLSTSKILVESFPWAIAQKTRKYSSIHNVLEAALEMAALGGYSKIVEYLLQNGAETFLLQALEAALRGCHSKVIQVLLATISKLEDYTRFEVGNCSYTSPDAWIKADFDTLLDNRQTAEDWWRPKEDADVLLKERYVFFTSRVSETSWWQQSKTNGPGSRQTLGMDDPQGKYLTLYSR
jgi:ankyrin repeat protein